jgi:NAD(P)-dependent dehydrogenase (short-subunit alcohol dehydrogenase family)
MHTNVLAAMRLLPQLVDALAPGARLAVLSSRMGSIGLRNSPSGWLYRASKAALNSVLKDASLVLAGRATCVSLHPGWVRTDMGGGRRHRRGRQRGRPCAHAGRAAGPPTTAASSTTTASRWPGEPGAARTPTPKEMTPMLLSDDHRAVQDAVRSTCRPRSRRTPPPGTRATSSRQRS